MVEVPIPTFGGRLQFAIARSGIKAAALAKAANVSYQAAKKWMSGSVKTLESGNLLAVANALKIRPEWLTKGTGPMASDGHQATAPLIANEATPTYRALPDGMTGALLDRLSILN